MNLLEEHNYGAIARIKTEKEEKNPFHVPELDIKMEYEYNPSDHDESSVDIVVPEFVAIDDVAPREIRQAPIKTNLKAEVTEESGSESESILSNLSLTDMKKACVLQTCLGILDSSSSDDDELMLLWLMYRNRKKKMKKKRRMC